MTRIEQLEQKVKRLEQKICCKTQFFDTVEDLPTEGSTGAIYVTDDGNIYVWNGVDYILNGLGDAYYTNSYVERLKALGSDVQYSNYLGTGTAATTLVDNQIILLSIYINKTTIINGAAFVQSTQGSYTADNYNGIGLYSYDLVNEKLILVASTTNDGDIWKAVTGTYVTKDFTTPVTLNKGIYYIAFLYNNSAQVTAPTLYAHNTQTTVSTIFNKAGLSSAIINGHLLIQNTLAVEILNTDITNQFYGTIFYLY